MKRYLWLALLPVVLRANIADVITNGTFETGNLSGWNVNSTVPAAGCDSNWATISTPSAAPLAGCSAFSSLSALDGSYSAAMYEVPALPGAGGSLTSYLTQIFTAPTAPFGSASLQWEDQLPTVNWTTEFVSLSSGADTWQTVFYTGTGSAQSHSFDVTSFLSSHAGQQIQLTFEGFLAPQLGNSTYLLLDDVSLQVATNPGSVPETSSPLSFMTIAAVLAFAHFKWRARQHEGWQPDYDYREE